jgi:hypothetical protein
VLGDAGIEPLISRMLIVLGDAGIEPRTARMLNEQLYNLSYIPVCIQTTKVIYIAMLNSRSQLVYV